MAAYPVPTGTVCLMHAGYLHHFLLVSGGNEGLTRGFGHLGALQLGCYVSEKCHIGVVCHTVDVNKGETQLSLKRALASGDRLGNGVTSPSYPRDTL